MRFRTLLLTLATLLAGCGLQGSPFGFSTDNVADSTSQLSVTGRYLVHFRDAVSTPDQAAALAAAGDSLVRDITPLGVCIVTSSQAGAGLDAQLVDYVEPDGPVAAPALLDGNGQPVQARSGWSPTSLTAANTLGGAGVQSVGPPSSLLRSQALGAGNGVSVNDPLVADQWGLSAVHAQQAWEQTMGQGIVVAVIDTGVDLSHPDLAGNLVSGISFVDSVQGPSGSADDARVVPFHNVGPVDDNGHGTHVAGIIAAEANDGIGGAGVAPLCKIMPVKVLAYNTKGLEGDVASGIIWAVDHGARILNLSLGGVGGSQTLARAVAYAEAHGALIVAAMGNDGQDPTLHYGADAEFPASLPGVVAVGATMADGEVAAYSNHGSWISLAAPGSGILSTTPTYPVFEDLQPGYDILSGTSMATPFVSGTAALIWSENPSWTADQVRQRLFHSATDLLFPGFDDSTGWGQVNAAAAVGAQAVS